MIAILARAAAFIGVPPALVYLVVYGSIAAVIAASYWWVYDKGADHMEAKWKAKELERVIYAQAETISRYRQAAVETKEQADQEIREAQERADLIEERMKQAEADNAQMEAQLASIITDKDKLDAALKALRSKCVANSRDVDLDRRLRNGKNKSR